MTSVTNLDDTRVEMDINGASITEALTSFKKLRSLAHDIETDPCVIRCETDSRHQETLHAQFHFCCAAEKIIFQMKCEFYSCYKFLGSSTL